MISFYPKQISNKAITLYLLSIGVVSVAFTRFMMKPVFIIIGIIGVLLFALLTTYFTRKWEHMSEKQFVSRLFFWALGLRLAWVTFSFFFYTAQTGAPFEFGASDSRGYHEEAIWALDTGWSNAFDYWFHSRRSYGDAGYPLWLTFLYSIFGPSVYLARVVKSLFSSWMCILIYRLTKRAIDEPTGRMAGIFCCCMPSLIMYCGLHVKETEMLFLTVAAIERADKLFRDKQINYFNLALVVALVLSLFFFRTVLGATVAFAVFTGLVFSPRNSAAVSRFVLVAWAIIAVGVLAGGTIATEAQSTWENRTENQSKKRESQVRRGNEWAQYATSTVMLPMMFVLPFPTMVDVDYQYNQQIINSGNFIRLFLGIFVVIAVTNAFFRRGRWRDIVIVCAFAASYLIVVGFSGFSNSERFLLPGMPFLLILSAYGITSLQGKDMRWVRLWYIVVPVACISWAFFKLGSRGIV